MEGNSNPFSGEGTKNNERDINGVPAHDDLVQSFP